MTQLTHLPATCSADQVVSLIERDGGVIIDNYLSNNIVEQIKADLMPYLTQVNTGRDKFTGYNTRRVGAIMARSPSSHRLALDPLINTSCKKFLEPFCDAYQLHLTQAVQICPGEREQTIHRDRGVWDYRVPRQIETQFSTIWALSDFTRENGATQVVPGSHRWDDKQQYSAEQISWAEMKTGSVFVYSGSVLHGGGANNTDSARLGLLLHYTLAWLRQEENQYLSCPPHIAKSFSPELRALIGYQSHYALGFCTPPAAPGEGVELVSPQAIFNHPQSGWPGL